MQGWRRRATAAVLGLGVGLALPREARAGEAEALAVVATIFAGFVIADLTFATYDIVVASKAELPSRGWAIAETAITAPQTLLFNPFFMGLEMSEKDTPLLALLILPTLGVTAMTTHGIWSLTTDRVEPGALAGVSTCIGADATMTFSAIGMAVQGRLSNRPVGVAELVLTLPQVILGSYEIGTRAPDRGAWIGLTAWSGALLLHGIASTIWGGRRERSEGAPPVPSPTTPPAGNPDKPPLLVPASIHFAPTMLSNGVAHIPGLVVGGVF